MTRAHVEVEKSTRTAVAKNLEINYFYKINSKKCKKAKIFSFCFYKQKTEDEICEDIYKTRKIFFENINANKNVNIYCWHFLFTDFM